MPNTTAPAYAIFAIGRYRQHEELTATMAQSLAFHAGYETRVAHRDIGAARYMRYRRCRQRAAATATADVTEIHRLPFSGYDSRRHMAAYAVREDMRASIKALMRNML